MTTPCLTETFTDFEKEPERLQQHVLSDLVGQLRVGADECADEVGASDDADEHSGGVHHGQPVHALVDHHARDLRDRPVGSDR